MGAPQLRVQTSILTSLRTSSSIHRRVILSNEAFKPPVCYVCRRFSVRTQQQAPETSPSTGDDSKSTASNPTHITLNSPLPAVDEADINLLDKGLDSTGTAGLPSKRTPHFKGKPAASKLAYDDDQESGSSVDDAVESYARSSPKLATWYKPTTERSSLPALNNLQFPTSVGFEEELSAGRIARPRVLRELNIHLSARTGRTVDVDPRSLTDLGARLRQLQGLVSRNKIPQDVFRQKFHERGGLKRKRLHSERWRRRFKNQFQETITRVQDLRRKGW